MKITEQHYAQIHPGNREKAREYAKRNYAFEVTYKVLQNKIKLMFYRYLIGSLSAVSHISGRPANQVIGKHIVGIAVGASGL